MSKIFAKRSMSLLLAIAMLLSLLPAVSLAAEQDITLNFNSDTMSTTGSANPTEWTVSSDAGWVVDPDFVATDRNPQGLSVLDDCLVLSMKRNSSSYEPWSQNSTNSSNNQSKAKCSTHGFKTTAPAEAGYYRVKLVAGKHNKGAKLGIYVNEQFAGYYDCYDENAASATVDPTEAILNTLYLTPETDTDGNAFMRVRLVSEAPAYSRSDTSTVDNSYCVLSKITLEYLGTEQPDSAKLDKVVIEDMPSRIMVGKEFGVSASVLMKDGSKRHINGMVRSTKEGYTFCSTKDADNYIVISTSDNASFTPDFQAANSSSRNGVFTNADGKATGKITASAVGDVTVSVSGKIGGEDFSASSAVTAIASGEQQPLSLKFNKAAVEEIYKIAPASWNVSGTAGWTVDAESTRVAAFVETNTHVYDDGMSVDLRRSSSGMEAWWTFTSGNSNNSKAKNSTLTLKTTDYITEGYYTVKLRGAKLATGGRYFVYVDEQFAGLYDSYDAEASEFTADSEFTTLNTIKITPEEDGLNPYVRVRFQNAEPADNKRPVAAFAEIALEPLGTEVPSAATVKGINIDAPSKIYAGTTVDIASYVEMTDGSAYHFSGIVSCVGGTYPFCAKKDENNFINVAVSDNAAYENKFMATGSLQNGAFTNGAGKAHGTLAVTDPGEVTVTVSGKINGEEFSGTKTLTVVAAPVRETVTYNFNSATMTSVSDAPSAWTFADNAGFAVDVDTTRANAFSATNTKTYESSFTVDLRRTSTGFNTWHQYLNVSTNNNTNARNSTLSFRIYGVEEGYYKVKFAGGKHPSGGRIFLYADEKFAGMYDCYDAAAAAGALGDEVTFNTLYLDPKTDGDGNNYVLLRVNIAELPKNKRPVAALSRLTLEPVAAESAVKGIGVDAPEVIYAGTNTEISAYLELEDGTIQHFNGLVRDYNSASFPFCAKVDEDNYINITVSDNAAFTPDFIAGAERARNGVFTGADGKADGMLYAADPGEVTVTVSGKINGEEFSGEKKLTITAAPKLTAVGLTFEKSSLPATRTTASSLTLTREDNTPYLDTYSVVYTSSDEDVATVDENGVVTAVGAGSAEITATVTARDGTVVSGNAAITVTARPVLSSITVTAKKPKLILNSSTEFNITGVMDDGINADMSGYTVTYQSLNEDVITVSASGAATAAALGAATVVVKVRNENGIDLTSNVELEVFDAIPSTVIDFKLTETKTDYSTPDVTPGYTVLKSNNYFRKYAYTDSGLRMLHVATRGASNRLWPADKNTTNRLDISVDIPFESDYSIVMHGGQWYSGGVYSVFVDGKYVGDYSSWDGHVSADGVERSTGEEQTLNTIHLTEGPHEISCRVRYTTYSTPYIFLNTWSFIPVEGETELSEIDTGALPSELAVGEVFEGTASAKMTDGSAYHFGVTDEGELDTVNTFTATSDNTAAVTLSDFVAYEIGKSGKSQFKLTGVAAGSSEVEFVAVVGGKTVTKKQTITVKDDPLASAGAKTEAEELFAGDATYLIAQPRLESGRVISSSAVTTTYKSLNEDIAAVEGNLLKTHAVGTATIEVTSTFNGVTKTGYLEVEVLTEGMTDVKVTAGGSEYIRYTGIEGDNVPLYVQAISNLGNEIDMTGAEVSAIALNPEYADISEDFSIIPVSVNPETEYADAAFRVTVKTADGRIRTVDKTLRVVIGKSKATVYTAEKVAAVRENYKKYDWAKSQGETYLNNADTYVENLDFLYNAIHSEGVPRGFAVGSAGDPDTYYCRYCAVDIRLDYGNYGWGVSPFTRAWKIQCPDCKRTFPTNDFESFYELGLNEYGEFDRLRALEAHRELFGDESITEPGAEHSEQWKKYYGYGVKGGYLTNEIYDKLEDVKTLNVKKGLRDGETTETWGVDDGLGYVPSKADGTPYTYENGIVERHTYIAVYLHNGVWRRMDGSAGVINHALSQCANAYYYTGDPKYGRVAAILLDRVADFYPGYDILIYGDKVQNSHGGTRGGKGKTVGSIWETGQVNSFIGYYDMVFDLYDDPYVVNYINEKGKDMKFRHAKETPSQIRTNIEDGIIREALAGLPTCYISGNFGYPQAPNARGAVVLDTMPESKEWIDYLMAPGWSRTAPSLGGGIDAQLLNEVDADGQGNEASSYNNAWHTTLISINNVLKGYTRYPAADLYNNPKFVQMFYSTIPLMNTYYTPEIGDSSSTLGKSQWMSDTVAIEGWQELKDPVFAQVLYLLNGNSAEGLHYGIDTANPERLEDEVQEVIDTYGELELDSDIMTNFGFSILRDGGDYTNATASTASETRRNVWMYFGTGDGHGHADTLNLGMTAFGLNFMPDLGYPEETGTQPNRLQWVGQTLSHNTVMVNEKSNDAPQEERSKPLHFDDGGAVQVMDVTSPKSYEDIDEYRRSVVYIRVDDENSYAVDFFRVLGGDNHLYSFHASSNEIKSMTGLDFTLVEDADGNYISGSQLDDDGNYKGTYVGRDETYIKKTAADGTVTVRLPVPGETLAADEEELPVEYGPDPNSPAAWSYNTLFPRGYTWLRNVDRDVEPENKVEIDFAIKDFNKAIKDSKGLGLYMTVLNDSNVKNGADAEISIADGLPPQKIENKNIDKLKYVLIKNEGENLDTTFTTVFEPYRSERYISDVSELALTPDKTPATGSAARAVKVTHTSGRIDYVFYSTDTSVTYTVTDGERTLSFRGFVGVYSVNEAGDNIYKYIHDGDILGEETGTVASVDGIVRSFTKEHSEENEIVIAPDSTVSDEVVSSLAGKLLVVDNGIDARSGAWKIVSAEKRGDDIAINTGRITTVRKYTDEFNPEKGYDYLLAEGQKARVALTYSEDGSPEFAPVSESITTSAGSSVSVTVTATSPIEGTAISHYEAEILPRGASFNEETGVFTWKPDSSQIGDNHVAITAVDELGRESTVHFTITVYGSTTGGSSGQGSTSGNTGTSSGGGGGGGGGSSGQGSTDGSDTGTDTGDQTDDGTTAPDGGSASGDASGDADGNVRFIDLGNHAWAADAINALADDGIVKGTTYNTYSPANNITRADYAILLVRAFNLTSDDTTNFDDVNASDYFAAELATARNTGIVNGIGDNKYAPRNTITRQDMMVIIYRALEKLGKLDDADTTIDASAYPDYADIADYAKPAVDYLISNGLVNGKNGLIAPTDYTTRAEVAVLLERILNYIAK